MNDYKRRTSLEQDFNLLRKLDSLGIISKVFLILGHPDETLAYYDEVVEKLKWMAPDEVRISFLTPFPGTELWNLMDHSRLLTTDYSQYTTFNPILRMKNLSPEELIEQRTRILKVYYGSEEFDRHVKAKVTANPHLNESFQEFYGTLGK